MSTKTARVRWIQDSGSLVQLGKDLYPLYLNEEFDAPVEHEFFKSALADGHCELVKTSTITKE
jgi:hypothetical protein